MKKSKQNIKIMYFIVCVSCLIVAVSFLYSIVNATNKVHAYEETYNEQDRNLYNNENYENNKNNSYIENRDYDGYNQGYNQDNHNNNYYDDYNRYTPEQYMNENKHLNPNNNYNNNILENDENYNYMENNESKNYDYNHSLNNDMNSNENYNNGEVKNYSDNFNKEISATIVGEHKEYITPDGAEIFINIKHINSSFEDAKSKVYDTFQILKNKLIELGVSETDICVDSYGAYNGDNMMLIKHTNGYNVDLSFSYKVDLYNAKYSIDELQNLTDLDVSYIKLYINDLETKYNDSMMRALENAKTKAGVILGNQDVQIVDIIEERSYSDGTKCIDYFYDYKDLTMEKIELISKIKAKFKLKTN